MTNRSSTGWIATLFTVLFMAHVSFGQSDSLALASGTTAANGTVSLNLVLTSPAGNEPAAVQWTVTFPAGNVTAISEAPGSSATSAGKTLSCASGSGTYTCVASGLNANIITNGPLAVVNLTMASGVASTAIGVSNALGASAAGSSITISATGGTVTAPIVPTSVVCLPTTLASSAAANCTVTLTGAAPAGGAI